MTDMTEERAREILGGWIDDGIEWLSNRHPFLAWPCSAGEHTARLDGTFTPDQLEAIAWWMRAKGEK